LTDLANAKEALQYVINNREHFPQYNDNWVMDRKKELSRVELKAEFGIGDTSEFKKALEDGEKDKARNWLEGIIGYHETDPDKVAQYSATWDSWLRDRQAELAQAKNNKGMD